MKRDTDAATHVAIVLLVALVAFAIDLLLLGECVIPRHVPQPRNVEGRR